MIAQNLLVLKTASSFVLSESNLIKTIIFQLIRLRSSNNSTLKEIKLAVEFHNPQIFWFPLFKKSYLRFCDQIYTKFYIFYHQAMLALWGKRTSGTGLKVALFITIGVLNTPMHMSLFSIRPRHGWSHRIVNPKTEIFAIDGEKRTCVMDIYTALKREEYYLV